MATSLGLNDTGKVSLGNTLIFSKISIGNKIVYSAGNTVTYHVDTNVVYQEEVNTDETVLPPKTFTPTKEGWEFVGWRQDDSASADVLDNLAMGDNPITLYAVFQKDITLSYNANGGSGTMDSETKQSYYNNETVSNPTFILSESSYVSSTIGYSFDKWAEGSPDGIQYTAGATVALDDNTVFYAVWIYVGNPFYIVQNGICKQSVIWTSKGGTNTVYPSGAYLVWKSGSDVTRLQSGQNNSSQAANTIWTTTISTNGNQHLRIIGSTANRETDVTINGVTKSFTKQTNNTWDIGTASTVTITANAKSWAYNDDDLNVTTMELF